MHPTLSAVAGQTGTVLTPAESKQFKAAEQTIERGRKAFVEVGNALMVIRDGRLYRATHPTFQDYCDQRWGFTRQRAHQLIQAAKAIPPKADPRPSGNGASTIVDIQPRNEAVARELNKVPEADREEVWSRAIIEAGDSQKTTARHVREAAGGSSGSKFKVVADDDALSTNSDTAHTNDSEIIETDTEIMHADNETAEPKAEEMKSRGVGVRHAHEALNCLMKIPRSDALRERGFETVSDWITANLPEAKAPSRSSSKRKTGDGEPAFPIANFIEDMRTLCAEALKAGHAPADVVGALMDLASDLGKELGNA